MADRDEKRGFHQAVSFADRLTCTSCGSCRLVIGAVVGHDLVIKFCRACLNDMIDLYDKVNGEEASEDFSEESEGYEDIEAAAESSSAESEECEDPWEEEARAAIISALEQARWGKGKVSIPVGENDADDGRAVFESFTSSDDLTRALDEIGSSVWNASVPWDDGDAVFEYSYGLAEVVISCAPSILKKIDETWPHEHQFASTDHKYSLKCCMVCGAAVEV